MTTSINHAPQKAK